MKNSVVSVVASNNYSIALKSDGSLWAWGRNYNGVFGIGSSGENYTTPIQITSIDSVKQISANGSRCVAVKNDGTVWSWGVGPLGNGANSASYYPVQVLDESGAGYLTGIKSVATHMSLLTLALSENGTVYSWGTGTYGQLGNGTDTVSLLPAKVVGGYGTGYLENVVEISAGNNNGYALTENDSVWAWGGNYDGQLGDGVYKDCTFEWTRVTTSSSSTISTVNGSRHALILNSDGTVWASGDNEFGQLGNGSTVASCDPVRVGGDDFKDVIQISTSHHSCFAVKNDGSLWAWGYNAYGQLGDGTSSNRTTPVQVKGYNGSGYLTDVVQVSGGPLSGHALKSDGTVWSWGNNSGGRLGTGDQVSKRTPVQVKGEYNVGYLSNVVQIEAGDSCTFALKNDGSVWSWGSNQYGQLGDGTENTSLTPVHVRDASGTSFLKDIISISSCYYTSIALKSDGTVWSWGYNSNGQLGNGTTSSRTLPVQVKGKDGVGFLENIKSISTGVRFSMALASDGTVWTWGYNAEGALGIGTSVGNKTAPVQVLDAGGTGYMSDIVSIFAADISTMIKSDGKVYGSGVNLFGQFGIGSSNNRTSTPVRVFTGGVKFDDYGNTFEEATEVFVNKTVTGEINYTNDVDCFKFSVPFDGKYFLMTTGYIILPVYNSAGNPLPCTSLNVYNLVAGQTYYIKVSGAIGPYSFIIQHPTESLYIQEAKLLKNITGDTEIPHLERGFVRAKVRVANEYVSDKSIAVIVTLMNANTNETVQVTVVEKAIGPGISETFTAGFNVPEDAENYKIVVQMWDNIAQMNLIGTEITLQ